MAALKGAAPADANAKREIVLSAEGLAKRFGAVTALEDVSLAVRRGTILGLVGPDGAGKTTLLRLLTGVYGSYEGRLQVAGAADAEIEKVKARLGYVPQRFSLYQDMTVLENLNLLGALYGMDKDAVRARAQEILTFTGLWQFCNRFAGQLSGGMKQKLALAAAVLHEPELLFLDEPTTGVDPVARREFWQLLYGLNKRGMTIITATPYMDEAELCHELVLMHRGRALACRTPQQLTEAYPYIVLELTGGGAEFRRLPELLTGCYYKSLQAFSTVYHVVTDDAARTQAELMGRFSCLKLPPPLLRRIQPSLEDVFILFSESGGRHA